MLRDHRRGDGGRPRKRVTLRLLPVLAVAVRPLRRLRAPRIGSPIRAGTTTLVAALDTLDGAVISMCQPQHRHAQWLQFLRLVQRKTPKHQQLHLIVDHHGTHTHPVVQGLAGQAPAIRHDFRPTSAS
ncbi:transposase [Variovorax paradoxus]|nr:transposase [Variovorax paradoxus]